MILVLILPLRETPCPPWFYSSLLFVPVQSLKSGH